MSKAGINTKPFKFKVGDIIKTNSGEVTVLKLSRGFLKPNQRWSNKIIKFKCNKCGFIDSKLESVLLKGSGCKICGGSRVVAGYNDIATTHPEYVHIFYNPEDAKKCAIFSDKKVDFKCENCGSKIPQKHVSTIQRGIILCPLCKDKILSLGEKIMRAVLKRANIEFLHDSSTDYSEGRRYDFILSEYKTIIEIDGMQHSIKPFVVNGECAKSIEEIQQIDNYKEQLALKNGIERYIHIDAKESDYNLIIQRIKDNLNNIIPIDSLNWDLVKLDTIKPVETRCLDLWNSGMKSTVDISNKLNLGITAVRNTLKRYAELGECDYNPEDARRLVNKSPEERKYNNIKAVICLNNLYIFDRMIWASRWCGTKKVFDNCKGVRGHAGNHPLTGEKLQWQYLDDYFTNHPEIKDKNKFYNEHVQLPVPRENGKF
jgi:Zn finger protein HypA/HybF involved in hydrogenase expression